MRRKESEKETKKESVRKKKKEKTVKKSDFNCNNPMT